MIVLPGGLTPYTLYPVPYTLHIIPCALNLTPYSLCPVPYSLTPFTLYPVSYTLHITVLHLTPFDHHLQGCDAMIRHVLPGRLPLQLPLRDSLSQATDCVLVLCLT